MKKTFTYVIALFFSTQIFALHCVKWPQGVFVPNVNAQGQKLPDYGIYWFKADGSTVPQESVMKACNYADAKCRIAEKNYFDPNKPTIIFIHGWVPFSVKTKGRIDFCYQYTLAKDAKSPVYNTLAQWKGYNVGIFYWNQFADEFQWIFPEKAITEVEGKIYGVHGAHFMQWKYLDKDGNEHTCSSEDKDCLTPKKSIIDLAFDSYQQALPKDYHQPIRITGQSLGTQVAIQLTAKIMQNPTLPQPTVLILMDPFFSPNGRFAKENNLPDSVAEYNSSTVSYIRQLYHQQHPNSETKFPIIVYRTSNLSFPPLGDPAVNLMNQVDYHRVYPLFLDGLSGLALSGAQHYSSAFIYFATQGQLPSTENISLSEFPNANHTLDLNKRMTQDQKISP